MRIITISRKYKNKLTVCLLALISWLAIVAVMEFIKDPPQASEDNLINIAPDIKVFPQKQTKLILEPAHENINRNHERTNAHVDTNANRPQSSYVEILRKFGGTIFDGKSNDAETNQAHEYNVDSSDIVQNKNMLQTIINLRDTIAGEARSKMFDPSAFNRSYQLRLIDIASASLAEVLKKRTSSCKSYLKEMFRYKEIVPFVVKPRNGVRISEPMCLVTTITDTRFHQLEHLLQSWKGCITLVVYLEQERTDMILELLKLYIPTLHDQITVHFVYTAGSSLLPINFLRNLGLMMTTSDYVLYTDIDLLPTLNLYDTLMTYIEGNSYNISGDTAIIVPAFALNNRETAFPQTKSQIKNLVMDKKAVPFYMKEYKPAYGPTNYDRWMKTTEGYDVTIDCYKEFEPYVVMRNRGILYSELFVHRFLNKVVMFTELCLRRYRFVVEPREYLTHVPHVSDKMAGSVLAKYNIKSCAYSSYRIHYEKYKQMYSYHSSKWSKH